MDWFQFVAGMTGSLAWPIAAVIIVCIFRKGIIERIPNLSKFTLPGGVSAEFGQRLDRLADAETGNPALTNVPIKEAEMSESVSTADSSDATVVRTTPNAPIESDPEYSREQKVFRLEVRQPLEEYVVDKVTLRANPTGVVMESWKLLESKIRAFAKSRYPTVALVPIAKLLKVLVSTGAIQADEGEMLDRLYSLRNLAAHSSDRIDADEAQRFKNIALLIGSEFDSRNQSGELQSASVGVAS